MSELEAEHASGAGTGAAPIALILCADLMFAVQLQNMARAAGLQPSLLRPGAPLPNGGAVLIVNLGDRGGQRDWESSVREAVARGIPVVAFGPHMDAEARRAAKAAGASRVLANSNLGRDLPTILRNLKSDHTESDYIIGDG